MTISFSLMPATLGQDTRGRRYAAMSGRGPNSLGQRRAKDASEVQQNASDAVAEGPEQQPTPFDCIEKLEGGYWDVAMDSQPTIHSGDSIDEIGSEDDFLDNIVFHFEDEIEEEMWGDLSARENAIPSNLLPSSARPCFHCATSRESSPAVMRRRGSDVQLPGEERPLSRSCTFSEGQVNHYDRLSSSASLKSAPSSLTCNVVTRSGSGVLRQMCRIKKISSFTLKTAGAARNVTEPPRLTEKKIPEEKSTSTVEVFTPFPRNLKRSSKQEGVCSPVAERAPSVMSARRSCSLPLPSLASLAKQPLPCRSFAAEQHSLSPSFLPRLQQQLNSLPLEEGHYSTCATSEICWSCCCKVSEHAAQQRALSSSIFSTKWADERPEHLSQGTGDEADNSACAIPSRSRWGMTPALGCSGRAASASLYCGTSETGRFRSLGGRRAHGSKSGCHSTRFSRMECPRITLALLFMLLSLAGELLFLQFADTIVRAKDVTGYATDAAASGSDRSNMDDWQPEEAAPLSRKAAKDSNALDHHRQFEAELVGTTVTAKALWLASNIIYIMLLGASLLRFLLFASPDFAPVACIRLMTCVSIAFLLRGLWILSSALEDSTGRMGAAGSATPDGSSNRFGTSILCTVLDASGIWAFPPEWSMKPVYSGCRPLWCSAEYMFTQNLILSILVCFWVLYTSKRWIIAYCLVPSVSALICALRFSAAHLAAAVRAAAATGDAGSSGVPLHFRAAEATTCILMAFFVLFYHLLIEAAVQKHLQYACWRLKTPPTVFPSRAFFDRFFACYFLQGLCATIENLRARIDSAIGDFFPAVLGETAQGECPKARLHNAAASEVVHPAPFHSGSSPVSVQMALNSPPTPVFQAFPRVSCTRSSSLFSTVRGPGARATVAEVTEKNLRRKTKNSGSLSNHLVGGRSDSQCYQSSNGRGGRRGSESRKSRNTGGCTKSSCCCRSIKNDCNSASNTICNSRGRTRCTTQPDLSLEKDSPYISHSVVELVRRSECYDSSHCQSMECRGGLSDFIIDPSKNDIGAEKVLHTHEEMLLHRVTLAYAGSGDFDLHLFFSLRQVFTKMLHKHGSGNRPQRC